jgi:hypothetical protein
MTDEQHVSELMHVLAVSPEKRNILVEQIRMSRQFGAMTASIAPSRAADSKLWERLGSVDTELAARQPGPATPPVSTPPTLSPGLRPSVLGLIGTLLIGVGLGVGYLMANASAEVPTTAAISTSQLSRPTTTAIPATTRESDSLAALRTRIEDMGNRYSLALAEIERLRSRPAPAPIIRYVEIPAPSRAIEEETATTVRQVALRSPQTAATRTMANDSVVDATVPPQLRSPGFNPDDLELERSNAFQVGLRNNLRYSLTRVYGLPNLQNTLTDRELYVGTSLTGNGTTTGIGAGIAGGQTMFSFIAHSNADDPRTDTVFYMTRLLWYGRGYIAPKLFALEDMDLSASLEIGGGGTQIGPFGTLGLDLEYLPSNWIAIHAGASAWQIWTQIRNQSASSTNLNAYWGAAVRF